ncbi:MAG: efflux RND transporter periplasmic adaptor subunit [Leeuwenhoekiella sp.]
MIVFSCGNSEEKDAGSEQTEDDAAVKVTKEQFDASNMQLGPMLEREFPVAVEATGSIDVPPENKAMVSSFAAGYVKRTPLLIGDKVKRGQFLASLENPDFVQMQQDYMESMQQLTYLKSEYERQKELVAEKITSQKNYLKAESEYKRNLAMYEGLKKKLQMLNIDPKEVENGNITATIGIYAPISGSITEMRINKGMYVSAADELMQIIDPDHLHIELNVFEKDIMNVKEGQDILLVIPEAETDTIQAEVHLVGTSIDEQKRTVKVHGHFKNESERHFVTGMFVEAQIITSSKQAMALPTPSIVSLDDTDYVLALKKQNDSMYFFDRREVMPGDAFDNFTVIKNSNEFNKENQFLLKGAFNLIQD